MHPQKMANHSTSDPAWEDLFERATISGENASTGSFGNQNQNQNANLYRRLHEVQLSAFERNKGALRVGVNSPTTFSVRVSTEMYWQGMTEESKTYLNRRHRVWPEFEHSSFELYRKKKFMTEDPDTNWAFTDDEDGTLLDVECYAYYGSSVSGAVSLEGFGLECWAHSEPRTLSVPVSYVVVPEVPMCKLLRRVDELRRGDVQVGRDQRRDLWDLLEMIGEDGLRPYTARNAPEKTLNIPDLFEQLNRRDMAANLAESSSVSVQAYATQSYGLSDFLWQMILSKELARRLESYDGGGSFAGFTEKILASLIIADRWFRNTKMVLEDTKEDFTNAGRPATDADRARAEQLKTRGNRAMDQRDYEGAIELYKQAIAIDGFNAIYRCNLSAALAQIGKYWASQEAAFIATDLDPGYAKAWARLGFAELKLGRPLKAKEAYTRAIEVAGPGATLMMKHGVVDAQAKLDAELKYIERERNPERKDNLRKAYEEQVWDVSGKSVQMRSVVHERQAEGLLVFAEKIKWPYVDDVREQLTNAYKNVEAGGEIVFHLHDWLLGVTLPGKWFSFTIMAALVMCTPDLANDLGVALYYEAGIFLPTVSFWRERSVLGRVLASFPGVVSLNGWVGPCPPVKVVGKSDNMKPRYMNLKAQDMLPSEYTTVVDMNDVIIQPRPEAPPMRSDEDAERYIAEVQDSSKWSIPEPPVQRVNSCEIREIRVKAFPHHPDVAARIATGEFDELDADNETEYLASIEFQLGDSSATVTYTLHTNPVFVALKPCFPGRDGAHPVHARDLGKYKNIWTVDKLKDYTLDGWKPDDVLIINATGNGERVLAQAWCAERGKNAIIRTKEGPCFACAIRAAGKAGLGLGVLIWVS
ncbi:hypothetical protein BJX64DRAFT_258587 [Aspergillus heterothallicus]